MRVTALVFDLASALLAKFPAAVELVSAELVSLGLHLALLRASSNSAANLFVGFFRLLRRLCEPGHFVYLLTRSNFFFDLRRLENALAIHAGASRSKRAGPPARIPRYLVREIYRACRVDAGEAPDRPGESTQADDFLKKFLVKAAKNRLTFVRGLYKEDRE